MLAAILLIVFGLVLKRLGLPVTWRWPRQIRESIIHATIAPMPTLPDDTPRTAARCPGILELAARSMFQLFSSVSRGMFLVDRTCRIVW